MASWFKNCRPTIANTPTKGEPWAAGEVRPISGKNAQLLATVSGFRFATEDEFKAWQDNLDALKAREEAAANAADPETYCCAWCDKPYKTSKGRDKHQDACDDNKED